MFYSVPHAPDVGAMPVNDKQGHHGQVDKQGLVIWQMFEAQPDRQRGCSGHRRQSDVASHDEDPPPYQQHTNDQLGCQNDQRSDQRRCALPAFEAVIDRPDMAKNCTRCAYQRQPGARNFGVQRHERDIEARYEAGTDDAFAHIDDHDAKREQDSLRAKGVGTTCIAATHRADVDSAT